MCGLREQRENEEEKDEVSYEIPVAAITSYHKQRLKTTQMCYLTVVSVRRLIVGLTGLKSRCHHGFIPFCGL